MKKTPFLSYILAALLACSGIPQALATTVELNGNQTLDMSGGTSDCDLIVTGTGNTMRNGSLIGTLTLKENSYLYSDSAMASWDGPTSITMKNGSRLEMAVGYDEEKMAWRDCWINDISAIKVDGVATIKDAFIRIKPGTEYTLGNGVENLVGEGITSIALDNSIFNLDNKTTNLNIKVWAAFDRYNVIKNGTVNTHVEIDSTGKLTLDSVTIGDNATFTMGNGAELDMGNAQGTAWLYPANGATVTVSNGRIGLQGGTPEYWAYYTMASKDGKTTVTGNGYTLNLGENVTFATDKVACFLVDSETIGNQANPVNIDVTSHGHFIFGKTPEQIGEKPQIVNGNVSITYVGDGSPVAMDMDVDIYYQLVGSLNVNAANGRVNAGIIGMETDTTSTGTVEAKQVYLSGFVGKSLALKAANNGGEAIHVEANAMATDSLKLDAHVGDVYGDIVFGGKLSGSIIELNAKNIKGTGNPGDSQLPTFLEFSGKCIINATGTIDIQEGFKGGELSMEAAGNIALDLLGTKDASLASADILSAAGGITMRAFTGENLKATAKEALTISDSVAASGNAELAGGRVLIAGPIAASGGNVNIESTAGNIIMLSGRTLSAGDSVTLDSMGHIIGSEAHVLGGDLTATAVQSITLGSIGTAENAVGKAVLTSQVESITASSFTGSTLKVSAKGAVSINGGVSALSGNVELTGNSVSIGGALAANNADASITSTAGDIKIGGTLSSGTSSTLVSAADIIIGTLDGDGNITSGGDVTGGALTATAAQSIKLGNIDLNNSMAAELTATGGSITAGAFTGGSLKANAGEAVILNGDVTSTGNTDLTGGSVSIKGSIASAEAEVQSTSGDIAIDGTLSAAVSSTLDSAGDIAIGGNVTGGDLTATAAQSITMQAITIGDKAADLTAANGGISAESFTGAALTAAAAGAVTINGDVTSTGRADITGGSVSIKGSIASAEAEVQSTSGDITIGGNVTGNALTATAGQSITAGNVTARKLTATAAGTITLSDVAVSQSEAQIVSTGEGGNVVLRSFSGGGAQIKATRGSITVATGATGSASTNKNTFIAAGSVTFNGATGNNSLSHTIINAPQVNWSNGTTLKDVTVSHWAPPANSPLLLPAAGNGVPQATLTVNGFLELTESSTVNGNVVINKQDNIIPAVTVDHSTITGRVSGATELVLNSGSVGNVVVDNNSPNDLTVVSSGKSSITGVPFDPDVESYAKLRIAALSLNGGKLTVSPKTLDYPDYPDDMETRDEEKARLQVATLMVANNTTVAADLELLPIGENEFSTMIFNLSAANETTACLTLEGDLLSYIPGEFDPTPGGKISISLNGNADVEGGKRYALIALASGQNPTFWNEEKLNLVVSGLAQKPDDLFWNNGTLYFQNGGELTRAVWSPDTSHQWNTTDQNWLQDGYRYRYKDGVTVVFDDTGNGGVVELEGELSPSSVLVNNSAENAYTFTGSGKITGESTKLIKMGSGKLTIQTANSYGGGTTINEGTLVVAHDEALGSGEVILEGGALEIDNGPKKFRLTVTGQNTRLEGGGRDAFTGTLTLRAGSQLNSSGGALMATQYGIDHIVMENGSTLTMTSDDDNARRIWINKISEFTVYAGTEQDAPKLVDTYLYIDSGFTYKLGATTGENINSLQNLRGEGSTAFLLDSSTLDLNSKTTKLNIIVDNVLPQGPSTVREGEIDANVVVCEKNNPSADPNELKVINARIGNNASISLGAETRLIMSGVAIEAGATFSMGNAAYLDLGGTFAYPSSVSLGAFTFTGANATIDHGSLYVERKETGVPVVLGTNLSGTDTRVSLHEEASLDLGGHVLSVKEVNMSEDAASASIGNGTLNSALAVESGKTLHLGNALTIAGNLSGGGTITKENDGTASVSGGMKGFTGNVQVQGGELNIMGIAEAASLKVADVTIMSGTLGVYQGGTTGEENEGTLTIRNGSKLAAGHGAKLNANLVMEGGSTLDVHSTEGAGLLMGSSVTLSKGMTLKDYSADWATWKVGTKYVLFSGVDGLDIGNGIMTGSMDYTQWVDAKEYFSNIEESNRYFLCYGGAPAQNAKGILTAVNDGSNVGMVYIMAIPEPTTSTLSLLALAGLAARRRRK